MSHLSVTVGDEFTTTNVSQYRDKGRKVINQYIVLKELARGSHGKVKQVLDKDSPSKKLYAMKIIKRDKLLKRRLSKDKTAFDDVEREVAIMKKLNHPNVVRLVEVMDDPNCSKLYLIMELLAGGSVMQLMQKRRTKDNPHGALSIKECHSFFVQLILGLQYCHEAISPPIIHRDIKPENLLLDVTQKVMKIADFGVAKILENSIDSGTVGSGYFMAPEVTKGIKHNGKASDIWSCGVTLYKMVTGKYPFTGPYIFELYQSIQNKEPEYPSTMNSVLKDLLQRILEKDPDKRITLSEIKRHDWITSNGVSMLPDTSRTSLSVEPEEIEGAITSVFKNVRGIVINRRR